VVARPVTATAPFRFPCPFVVVQFCGTAKVCRLPQQCPDIVPTSGPISLSISLSKNTQTEMSATKHSEFQENFLRQPSKVDDIIKFLGEMEKSNKME